MSVIKPIQMIEGLAHAAEIFAETAGDDRNLVHQRVSATLRHHEAVRRYAMNLYEAAKRVGDTRWAHTRGGITNARDLTENRRAHRDALDDLRELLDHIDREGGAA